MISVYGYPKFSGVAPTMEKVATMDEAVAVVSRLHSNGYLVRVYPIRGGKGGRKKKG